MKIGTTLETKGTVGTRGKKKHAEAQPKKLTKKKEDRNRSPDDDYFSGRIPPHLAFPHCGGVVVTRPNARFAKGETPRCVVVGPRGYPRTKVKADRFGADAIS